MEFLRILFQEFYVAFYVVFIVIFPLDLQLLVDLLIGASLLYHLLDFFVYFICIDWPILHHYHHSVVQTRAQLLEFLPSVIRLCDNELLESNDVF